MFLKAGFSSINKKSSEFFARKIIPKYKMHSSRILYMKEHLYLKYWLLRLSLREAHTDETHNSATEEKLLKQ